jgi:hypothetical protein
VFSESYELNVGFGALTAVTMNVAIFWDIAPCSPYVKRCFGGTYHFLLQGRKSAKQETSVQPEESVHILTTRRFIPEDGIVYGLNILILFKRV